MSEYKSLYGERQHTIKLLIGKTLDTMDLRKLMHKFSLDLKADLHLQNEFQKGIDRLRGSGWDKDFTTRDMILDLEDDYKVFKNTPLEPQQLEIRRIAEPKLEITPREVQALEPIKRIPVPKRKPRVFEEITVSKASKCEHTWKANWLDSGYCLSCYKELKYI